MLAPELASEASQLVEEAAPVDRASTEDIPNLLRPFGKAAIAAADDPEKFVRKPFRL